MAKAKRETGTNKAKQGRDFWSMQVADRGDPKSKQIWVFVGVLGIGLQGSVRREGGDRLMDWMGKRCRCSSLRLGNARRTSNR